MCRFRHGNIVAGCIRLDALSAKDITNVIENAFGSTCSYDDPETFWNVCTVPCGSEGSVQYHIRYTGHAASVSWGLVAIWGDLRDYDNYNAIYEWIKQALAKLQEQHIWVRQCSVVIEVEYSHQYLVYHDHESITLLEIT